jgi:hypothetical protein
MPLSQLKTADFGKSRAGLSGSIGYSLYSTNGSVYQARTTAGIYEITDSSGIYASFITFPDDFRGSIVWDSGENPGRLVFAVEQYNYEENNPNVDTILTQSIDISGTVNNIETTVNSMNVTLGTISTDVQFIKDIEGGRWKIDTAANQMIFYKDDNSTVVARFNLFDSSSNPTSVAPFERTRV